MVDEARGTGPAEARRLVDRLEAEIVSGLSPEPEAWAGGLQGDWTAAVPGSGEPPD